MRLALMLVVLMLQIPMMTSCHRRVRIMQQTHVYVISVPGTDERYMMTVPKGPQNPDLTSLRNMARCSERVCVLSVAELVYREKVHK